MRAGAHLDNGRDPILFDAGHDAGKAIARGLGDDRPRRGSPSAFLEETRDLLEPHQTLPPIGAFHGQAALGLPASKCFDRDTEHFCRLANPDPGRRGLLRLWHTAEYCRCGRFVSRSFGGRTQKIPAAKDQLVPASSRPLRSPRRPRQNARNSSTAVASFSGSCWSATWDLAGPCAVNRTATREPSPHGKLIVRGGVVLLTRTV